MAFNERDHTQRIAKSGHDPDPRNAVQEARAVLQPSMETLRLESLARLFESCNPVGSDNKITICK